MVISVERASPGRRPTAPRTCAGPWSEPARRPAVSVEPPPEILSGPVDVCVAVPKLSLDRPFPYLMPSDAAAGIGSLVSVPFHGRTTKGWVLGPAESLPAGRLLPVRRARSVIRFFD